MSKKKKGMPGWHIIGYLKSVLYKQQAKSRKIITLLDQPESDVLKKDRDIIPKLRSWNTLRTRVQHIRNQIFKYPFYIEGSSFVEDELKNYSNLSSLFEWITWGLTIGKSFIYRDNENKCFDEYHAEYLTIDEKDNSGKYFLRYSEPDTGADNKGKEFWLGEKEHACNSMPFLLNRSYRNNYLGDSALSSLGNSYLQYSKADAVLSSGLTVLGNPILVLESDEDFSGFDISQELSNSLTNLKNNWNKHGAKLLQLPPGQKARFLEFNIEGLNFARQYKKEIKEDVEESVTGTQMAVGLSNTHGSYNAVKTMAKNPQLAGSFLRKIVAEWLTSWLINPMWKESGMKTDATFKGDAPRWKWKVPERFEDPQMIDADLKKFFAIIKSETPIAAKRRWELLHEDIPKNVSDDDLWIPDSSLLGGGGQSFSSEQTGENVNMYVKADELRRVII